MRSSRGAVAIAVTVSVLAPGVASAAPGSLGTGHDPAVAVDAAGTAHIAWIGTEPLTTTLHFCRLPRGGTACTNPTPVLSVPGTSITRPFVSVEGGTVRVLSYRYGQDPGADGPYLLTSSDGGTSFGPATQVGTVDFHDAAVGPGAGISLATDAYFAGELYQRVPTSTPKATTSALLSTTHPYQGAVGLVDATTPLVVFADASGDGQFRRYTGSGDIHDPATWTPAQPIGHADRNHLAGGPAGLFLMSQGPAFALRVRKYAGGTFGDPVAVPGGTGELASSHLAQDPIGRLHAVWPRIDADAFRLYYATSDDGATWQQGALAADTVPFYSVRAGIAPDHVGLVVWETSPSSDSEIRFLPLGPTPPVATPIAATTTTPATAPQPAPVIPLPPAVYAGAVKGVTVTDDRATYTITVPRGCVAPGQRFRVTLTWKRKKRKGNLFVKVRRADFYLETRRIRIDQKAPFVHTFTVRAGQARGSTIRLRARAFIKVRRGRAPTKSIRAQVKVCA